MTIQVLHPHKSTDFTQALNILILVSFRIKPTRCTNFSSLFWNETLHVSDNSSVRHQELFTVHTVVVYVKQVLLTACEQQTTMTYTTAVRKVKNAWWWTVELSATCRVSFKNKFEKLAHLIGLINRIYHNALSHERQIRRVYSSACPSAWNNSARIPRIFHESWCMCIFRKFIEKIQCFFKTFQE